MPAQLTVAEDGQCLTLAQVSELGFSKPGIASHHDSIERRGKYYLSKHLWHYVLVNKHQMLIYQHSGTGPETTHITEPFRFTKVPHV